MGALSTSPKGSRAVYAVCAGGHLCMMLGVRPDIWAWLWGNKPRYSRDESGAVAATALRPFRTFIFINCRTEQVSTAQ